MAGFAATCRKVLLGARAAMVTALPWHEVGATPAQELGWTLATVARYLGRMEQEDELDLEAAAGQIALRIAPGRDLFLGIAKLRALRLLWSKLLGVYGLAEVASTAYPDATQFDPKDPYYDPKSTRENPRWLHVDVKLVRKTTPLLLKAMREAPQLSSMRLLRPGNRLSITPVTPAEWRAVLALLG